MMKGRGIYSFIFVISLSFVIWILSFSVCEARSIWSGDKTRNIVALTFDDGPKPEYCQSILDTLDKYGAKATFFVVGREARENPDLIMRMDVGGHEVANHTYSHVPLNDLSQGEALGDIQKCSSVIYDITGKQPKYFRPPGGKCSDAISRKIRIMGLKTVYWSLNAVDYIEMTPGYEVPEDYKAMARDLSKRIVDKVSSGSIILLHNGSEQTVIALPFFLSELKNRGYAFVTVSELMEENI